MARPKIAIIGGGPAGITAAYELACLKKFDITVFQEGWALGGKCASGRPDGGGPSEEHGLHMLMGFYKNAHELTARAYTSAYDSAGAALWAERFVSRPRMALADVDAVPPDFHNFELPPLPPAVLAVDDIRGILRAGGGILGWMNTQLESVDYPDWLDALITVPVGSVLEAWNRFLLDATVWLEAAVITAIDLAQTVLDTAITYASWLFGLDGPGRKALMLIDFALSCTRGIIRDKLLFRPLTTIDHWNFWEWLRDRGNSRWPYSPLVRGFYGGAFAFPGGDPWLPDMAAGVTLRIYIRSFLGYEGAPITEMQVGMGEAVFVPLYQALDGKIESAHPVKFRFFHRLTGLELADGDGRIGGMKFDIQAKVDAAKYSPLVGSGKEAFWPIKPLVAQLESGSTAASQKMHRRWAGSVDTAHFTVGAAASNDFNAVIVAFPPGAQPGAFTELTASRERWATMIAQQESVRTMALQVWLKAPEPDEVSPHLPDRPVLGAYQSPFDLHADMTPVLDSEGWTGANRPKSLHYFCGVHPSPEDTSETPTEIAEAWKKDYAGDVLRGASDRSNWPWPGRYELDPDNVRKTWTNSSRAESDRYILSRAGTIAERLPPMASGFANLYLAGDWTHTPLNVGCFEAAVMAGKLAARGVAHQFGIPEDIEVLGGQD